MSKQIVVVGASRGIGLELVKRFASDKNTSILALARNIERLENEFSTYANVSVQQLDLEDSNLREKAEHIFRQLPSIDILVNNAGKLVNKPFLELTEEDIRSCYQVNAMGVFAVVQAAIPMMLEKGGHVVSISSMGGFQGSVKFPGLSAYSTSKAAVASLTELLAEEYKESAIQFNCLTLGAAQTEMLEEAFPGYIAPVTAEKMAEFIADFALNSNQWINGKIIPVSLSTP
jgi:3-oxoacyl-[acyl-carrier protein] reductase